MILGDPLLVVGKIAAVLDMLGVRYVVGGSVASSVYGIPRATQDVDLVAELYGKHAAALVAALSSEFYIDVDMVRDALAHRSSFNVVHLATMFKADIFAFTRDPWMTSELSRARSATLSGADGPITIQLASPEDVVLHKLVWYRMGNEISDRQWNDVQGILKIQRENLDIGYLNQWAPILGVDDLLLRARTAAGHT
jgi:hypothetical protein